MTYPLFKKNIYIQIYKYIISSIPQWAIQTETKLKVYRPYRTLNNRYTDQLINKNNRNCGLRYDIIRTLSSGYLNIKYYLT